MCLNPIKIKVNKTGWNSVYRPQSFFEIPVVEEMYSSTIECPCRRCVECQIQKQKDYTQYLTEVAKKLGNTIFLTLTYRPDKLPTVLCKKEFRCIDKMSPEVSSITGKKQYVHRFEFVDTGEFAFVRHLTPFEQIDNESFSGKNVPQPYPPCMTELGSDAYEVASLKRKDVQDWLKRCRIAYKRNTGVDSPMKYFCVGEYGTKSGRPHYHIMLFNCDKKMYSLLVNDWSSHYGFARLSDRAIKNKSIYVQGGAQSVAHYLAKYISKGSFDFKYIDAAEKPRIQSSSHLLVLTPEDRSLYLGLDWIKSHNLPDDWSLWTDKEQRDWYELVSKRMTINGFSLAKHMRDLIFTERWIITDAPDFKSLLYNVFYDSDGVKYIYEDYDEADKVLYSKNTLSYLYSSIARDRLDAVLSREYREVACESFDKDSAEFKEDFENFKYGKKLASSSHMAEELAKFYKHSSNKSGI